MEYLHTPAPSGYLQWHAWAAEMSKTHRQQRCPGCRLYKVWIPRVDMHQALTDAAEIEASHGPQAT